MVLMFPFFLFHFLILGSSPAVHLFLPLTWVLYLGKTVFVCGVKGKSLGLSRYDSKNKFFIPLPKLVG